MKIGTFLSNVGFSVFRRIQNAFYALGYFWEILKESLLFIRNRHVGFRVLVFQILFTGFEALGVISVLAVGMGAIIIVQGWNYVGILGGGDIIYTILITVITRELGPVLTAFIITARSGTAMATEIGTMVVSHEIEAYLAFGINPISYLVVPRFIGVVASMVLLNIYFNVFGLLGSYFVTQLFQPIQFIEYFSGLLRTLRTVDIISSTVKSAAFGIVISSVATYYGFRVERASTEIPVTAIKAVGRGFILCIIVNAIITLIYYL